MRYRVSLTDDAAYDLEELIDYIDRNDSPAKAGQVVERFKETFAGLCLTPQRGRFPRELADIGIREYREIYFKPYRIIYRIFDSEVVILLIADGRPDMRALLERRLLRS